MFLRYRIEKLECKVNARQALTDKLEEAHKSYGSSYYTDQYFESHRKYIELNSKLRLMKRRLKEKE